MSTLGMQYDRRIDKITVRFRDDPTEYFRQYYWVRKNGVSHGRVRAVGAGRKRRVPFE